MATIKDIAKAAGVSVTTVSNVIHGNTGRVSQKMQERIQRIMNEMNYIPNMGARMLVGNSSRIIGVIANISVYEEENSLQNPFAAELMGEIEKELQKKGYFMMLYSVKEIQNIYKLVENWNVDGIILVGTGTERARDISTLIKKPVIYTDCYFEPEEEMYNVGTDDEDGGYQGTRYLLSLGHQRIGFVDEKAYDFFTTEKNVSAMRYLGYLRALHEAGIEPKAEYSISVGKRHETEKLHALKAYVGDCSALFFTADYTALAAMDYFRHQNIRVPEDISIIGFDDITMAALSAPRLTTIRQDIGAKGRCAVRELVSWIENGKPDHHNNRIPVRLVIRESAQAVRK